MTTTSSAGSVNAALVPAKDTTTAGTSSPAGVPAPPAAPTARDDSGQMPLPVASAGTEVAAGAPEGEGEASAALPLVVGLDLSLTGTGICHMRGGQAVTATLRGDGTGVLRIRQLARAVREHCRGAALVVIEAPNYHMGKSAGFHERAGLHWRVLDHLDVDGRAVVEVRTSQIKTYATGKGSHPGLGKGPMVEASTRRYPLVETGGDDNQCDALWCAAMGTDHLTGVHVVPAAHRATLAKVQWPQKVAQ